LEPPAFAWPDAAPGNDHRADPWPSGASDRQYPADDRADEPGFQRGAAASAADHPGRAEEYQDAFAQLAARDAAEAPRAPAMSLLRRSEIIPPVPVAARDTALVDRASHRPRILLPLAGLAVLAAMVGWFVVQALIKTAPPAPPGARVAAVAPAPAPMPAAPGQTAAGPNPPVAAPSGSPAPHPVPAVPAAGAQPAATPPDARAPERSAAAAQATAARPSPAEAPAATPAPAASPPAPPAAPLAAAPLAAAPLAAPAAAPPPSAGPGLLVIAKADDTLRSLYARVYKGLPAPAFETVAAMNPHDIKLGDVVVFPAPPGGWKRPPNTAGR
jgi:hypothetical protein